MARETRTDVAVPSTGSEAASKPTHRPSTPRQPPPATQPPQHPPGATTAAPPAAAPAAPTTGTPATTPAAPTAASPAAPTAASDATPAPGAVGQEPPIEAGEPGEPAGPPPPDPFRLSDVDEWGRSEKLRALLRTVYDPLYRHWFRVEWEGIEHIPRDGGALLVANHAGAIPSDAPAIMHGIETELGRPVYGLADEVFKKVPVVNVYWQRLGGVQAHPDNAYRLLREQQQLVLTFPEGSKGPGKLYNERYQLRRFGRGGFVQIAMRAGVPIVPIAVVGAEESMPIVYRSAALAKLMGVPYFPITANMLLLGPVLGAVTWLPAKFKLRVLPPVTFDEPPDQPRYARNRVMDASEAIRQQIQDALHDMLSERKSVWTG